MHIIVITKSHFSKPREPKTLYRDLLILALILIPPKDYFSILLLGKYSLDLDLHLGP